MNKYFLKKSALVDCEFKDNFNLKNNGFEMEVVDSISNLAIEKDEIYFNFKRELKFTPENQFISFAEMRCCIESVGQKLSKQGFIEDLKNGKIEVMHQMVAKISLLLAQITSNTPFGTIITAPFYDETKTFIN